MPSSMRIALLLLLTNPAHTIKHAPADGFPSNNMYTGGSAEAWCSQAGVMPDDSTDTQDVSATTVPSLLELARHALDQAWVLQTAALNPDRRSLPTPWDQIIADEELPRAKRARYHSITTASAVVSAAAGSVATTVIALPAEASVLMVTIFVIVDGASIALRVPYGATVVALFLALASRVSKNVRRGCFLVYRGRRLDEQRTLESYGIGRDATITLVRRVLGGLKRKLEMAPLWATSPQPMELDLSDPALSSPAGHPQDPLRAASPGGMSDTSARTASSSASSVSSAASSAVMVDAADAADAANGPNLQELFSEIGLRTDTLAASSKKLYTAPNPLHEALRAANAAVVRVVISDRRTGKHLQIGSGVITNASGRIRHAAHTVVQCMTRHNLTSLDDIAIRIAVYNGNSDGSRWAYWAESLTSLDEMKEKDERGRYLEHAWLQIRGTVSMSPSKLYPNEMTTTYTLDSYTNGGLPAFDFIPLAVYAPTTPDARVLAVDWAPGYSEHIHIHPVGQVVIVSPTLLKVDVPLNHGASGSPLLVLDDHGNMSVVAIGSYAITEVWTAPSFWRLARTVHATTAVFGDAPIGNLTWVENAANLSLLAHAAETYVGGAEESKRARPRQHHSPRRRRSAGSRWQRVPPTSARSATRCMTRRASIMRSSTSATQ